MSTRARLTLIFTVLFGTIVVCLAIATYLLYSQDAYSKLDSGLRAAVDATAMSAEHEMAEHMTKEGGEADVRDVLSHAEAAAFPGAQILIRERNRLVAFRNAANRTLDLRTMPQSQLLSGSILQQVRVQARELAVPKFHTTYQIYSAKSVIPTERQLASLRGMLLLLISLGLVLASVAGYLLARKSLAPLAALAKTIETITSSDLSARVPVSNASDDISRLAARFNSLLDRLQHGFTMQRRSWQMHPMSSGRLLPSLWQDFKSLNTMPGELSRIAMPLFALRKARCYGSRSSSIIYCSLRRLIVRVSNWSSPKSIWTTLFQMLPPPLAVWHKPGASY